MRRMRRLRAPKIRDMVAENSLSCRNLVQPIFVDERASEPRAIDSMPGQFRQSLGSLAAEAGALEDLGIAAVLLFGLPAYKDDERLGSLRPAGHNPEGCGCYQGSYRPGSDNRSVPLRVHQPRPLRPGAGREGSQ